MFPKLIVYRKGFIYLESRFFNNKLDIYLMFSGLRDLYTISIFITSTLQKSTFITSTMAWSWSRQHASMSSWHHGSPFASPPSWETVRRWRTCHWPLSPSSFMPATVANLAPSIDFFSCAMADASLSLKNTMMATIESSMIRIKRTTVWAKEAASRMQGNMLVTCQYIPVISPIIHYMLIHFYFCVLYYVW